MTRVLLLPLLVVAFAAGTAQARADDHGSGGGQEVRVTANCGRGASALLRLRTDNRQIEVRFRLRQRHGTGRWRVAIVHEDRLSSRAARRVTRSEDSFELRRMLPDLPGSDTVVVRAWGPHGLGCRGSGTLRG